MRALLRGVLVLRFLLAARRHQHHHRGASEESNPWISFHDHSPVSFEQWKTGRQ
jgi:hypothetical protein